MNNEDQIIGYLLDEMTPNEKESFAKLLEKDVSLKNNKEEYKLLLDTLDQADSTLPSSRLQRRFDRFLADKIKSLDLDKNKGKESIKWLSYRFIGIAASILLLGIWVGTRVLPEKQIEKSSDRETSSEHNATMLQLVDSKRSTYRIRGVNMAYSLPGLDKELRNTLETVLFTDRSPNVRLAAAEALAAYADDPQVRSILLRALVDVEVPIVRITLISFLTGVGDLRAVPEFEKLLTDDALDKAVRDELHAGLIKLM